MSIEITYNGKVIHRSKNLRGLISHAGRVGVERVSVHAEFGVTGRFHHNDGMAAPGHHYGRGFVFVQYRDGSICRTEFADFTIARDFFRSRWQRWGLRDQVRCSDSFWSFI